MVWRICILMLGCKGLNYSPSSVISQCTRYNPLKEAQFERIYSKDESVTLVHRLKFRTLRYLQPNTTSFTTSSVRLEKQRRSKTDIFLQYCEMWSAVFEVIVQELRWSLSSSGHLCTSSQTPASSHLLLYSTEMLLIFGQFCATAKRLSQVRERHWSIVSFSNLTQPWQSWKNKNSNNRNVIKLWTPKIAFNWGQWTKRSWKIICAQNVKLNSPLWLHSLSHDTSLCPKT